MRTLLTCFPCNRATEDGVVPPPITVPATSDSWVVTKCPNGHDVGIIFQASGWARLFERALIRVARDQTRDAVLDAYTAFEMYLAEMPVRARYDREGGADLDRLRKELRPAVNRSENAMGAALAVASLVSKGPCPTWDTKIANVRNEAIHSGTYPSVEKAEEVCTEIARIILVFEELLNSQPCANPGPFHAKVWSAEVAAFRAKYPNIEPTFQGSAEMFDPTHSETSRGTVAERIRRYRESPYLWPVD